MNKTLLLSIIFIFSTELVFSQFGKKKDESNNKLETCGIGFIDDFSSSTNSLFDDSDRLLMTVDALKDRVGNLKDLEKTAAADSVQKIIAEVKLLKVKLLNLKNSSIELYKQVSNIKKRLNELDPLKIDEGAKVLLGTVEKVIKTIANSTKAIKNSIKAMEDLDELTDIDIKVQIDLDELKFSAVSVLIGDVERPELIGAPIVDEFVTASFDLYDTVISISIQATNISNKILKIKKLNPVTVVVEAKSIIEDLIKLGRTMWLIKTKSDEIILLAKSMPARAKEVGIKKAPKALKNIAVATKAVAFAAKEIPFQLMELFEIAKLIVKNFDLKIELNMDMFKQIDVYANFVAKPEPMNVEVIDAYIEETYGFYNQVFVMNQRIDSLIPANASNSNTIERGYL